MWTLGMGIILNVFFTMWMIGVIIIWSFISRLSWMRFSYLSWRNWIFLQWGTCNCYYVLTMMSFIWCYTLQWIVMNCWRKSWVIIWTSKSKMNLLWCSGMLIILYFIIVCFYWLLGVFVQTHGNIICIGIYFTWNFDFSYLNKIYVPEQQGNESLITYD